MITEVASGTETLAGPSGAALVAILAGRREHGIATKDWSPIVAPMDGRLIS